ncbi:MAG: AIR carboxylase family protein, partial [Ruminococcus sp.]|nr:AIR carboxylase family protein [Ruminococcus sp.]
KVAIIMGSTSDLEIMSQAINVLEGFGVEVVKKRLFFRRSPRDASIPTALNL